MALDFIPGQSRRISALSGDEGAGDGAEGVEVTPSLEEERSEERLDRLWDLG
jgi:hypothetical protein